MNRLVVLDGECVLCNRVAHFIDRHDPSRTIRIATTDSKVGRSLLEGQSLDPDDPPTWLYQESGRIYGQLDAQSSWQGTLPDWYNCSSFCNYCHQPVGNGFIDRQQETDTGFSVLQPSA